jgi:hypothetical protein
MIIPLSPSSFVTCVTFHILIFFFEITKALSQLEPNLVGMFIGWSSTKLMFLSEIQKNNKKSQDTKKFFFNYDVVFINFFLWIARAESFGKNVTLSTDFNHFLRLPRKRQTSARFKDLNFLIFHQFNVYLIPIGGFMVSVEDHGFEHRSGQTKNCKIAICCFST